MKKLTLNADIYGEISEMIETMHYLYDKFPNMPQFIDNYLGYSEHKGMDEQINRLKLRLAFVFMDKFHEQKEGNMFMEIGGNKEKQEKSRQELLFEFYSMTEEEIKKIDEKCDVQELLERGILVEIQYIFITQKQKQLLHDGVQYLIVNRGPEKELLELNDLVKPND